jgi:transposase
VENSLSNITDLSSLLLELTAEIDKLRNRVSFLEQEDHRLRWKNHQQDLLIRELEEELSKYKKPKKSSKNSHVPPSQEPIESKELRRTQSLRVSSGLKSGGQPGHAGRHLVLPEQVDREEVHSPDCCPNCGESLFGLPEETAEERLQIDLPEIRAEVVRHKIMARRCRCGCLVRGAAPAHVRGHLSYGPGIGATIGYLNTVHHLPFRRTVELIKELFHIPLSEGSVYNMLQGLQTSCLKTYDSIRDSLLESPVVGADETGMHVNKRLQWFWTFQTNDLTYIFPHAGRGKEAIDAHFPKGLPRSWLVTDRHASYFNLYVKGHQICLAHLLRELTWLNELAPNQKWSKKMKALLQEAIHKRKRLPWKKIDREKLIRRFNDLLAEKVDHLHKDIQTLQTSLIRHREHVLNFLFHDFLPSDNNASERSIRPLKVKQKVSGCFRTDKGALTFAVLHSVTDTARKNNRSPWLELYRLACI